MDSSAIFRKKYGSFRRFFLMLGKARLPYLWIAAYLAASVVIANVGVSSTEYSAALFAGNVGLTAVVLPYLFYQLLSLVLGSVSGLLANLCEARMDRNLRRMVWCKTVRLPLRFYETNNPKELLSRITTDISSISGLVMRVFLAVLTTAYSSFVILRKISSYDGALMWSLVAILPVNILISFIMGRLKFGVQDLINRRNAQLTAAIAERTNNLMLIKSMGAEEKEAAVGEGHMRASYRAAGMNIWITGLSLPISAIATALQTVVIILMGRGFYASGALELTQWIAYYGFAVQLTNILGAYCGYWTTFKQVQGSVDRVTEIMDERSEDLDTGEVMGSPAGGIRFEKVDFSFGGTPLFQGLDLDIPAGRITAVVGPSGSGKTTLLNLIDRLYPLAGGRILVGGRDAADYSLASFRRALGYVTQESVMYAGTIRSNLLHGLDRTPSEEELDEACAAVGILDYVRRQPLGYDAPVGESGASLSGGQRQRFSVARALLKRPDCLLLDEATAAMDIDGKAGVWASIRTAMAGRTVVYVAHDAQTIANADYVVVLRDGRVEAAGEREHILSTNLYCREMMENGEEEN
ncbi:MAG: ABC transporter ATP-binding protein [Oscillospiraceae bacterium]|jgi:ATP-binding cassette subfamily B protein AbcA/BmrA|nr:ABC transporter ATP-binding protein [Oscillospiraceae bacterium]